jgi:hypothetical protein
MTKRNSNRIVTESNIETLGPKVKEILKPEMFKVAQALSTVLGFKTFDDYIAICIKTNVQMFIEGGADIYEEFKRAYKHLGYERGEEKESDKEESVITR